MMRRISFFALLMIMERSSLAQQISVQQPVVATTSVNTTVTVPDRGSAVLGGVSSAQSGRVAYGPLRSGSSSGLSRQATSISANVFIHDLQAMDEALLNSAPQNSSLGRPLPGTVLSHRSSSEPSTNSVATAGENARKYELLARKSEVAGKDKIAKLHWQTAARYGSRAAATRLTELGQPTAVPEVQTVAR